MVQFVEERGGRGSSFGEGIQRGMTGENNFVKQFGESFSRKKEYERNLAEQMRRENLNQQEKEKEMEFKREILEMKARAEEQEMREKQSQSQFEDEESYNKIREVFGDKFADLWRSAPTGGRTELLKHGIEAKTRGINLDEKLGGIQSEKAEQSQEKKPNLKKDVASIIKEQDEGLLPSEKVKRGKERFDTGLKQYQEAGTKLRSLSMDKDRLNILDKLNGSKKLPKDLGRINVDDEGNLRFPFASNPETQRYVKTLNEFSSSAKDTFGSRVTNFDLAQYLKRFPTLMNSEEGRRQLLQQMKIVNDINSIYYKNLKNVYDEAGGVRNIDADVAERLAEQISEDKINELTEKFNQIGEFTSLPSASEFKGKKIINDDTGEILISNGVDWIPAE